MVTKKKTTAKKKTSSPKTTEKLLVENFVALQKVMTNLTLKFDDLSNNISKLLQLFELSAEAMAKKEINIGGGLADNSLVLEKLESLSDQNKIIARGLTLMHERVGTEQPMAPAAPRPAMEKPAAQNTPTPSNYQKSAFP